MSSDDTRKGACFRAEDAYFYALDIDECPREDTRKAACKEAKRAYHYAHYVDKCPG